MASKIIQNRGRLIDHIRNMDTNRDGVVDMDEFRASLKALDLGLTPEQEELLIASIDLDGDGILEYEELHSRLDLVVRAKARGSRMSLQPLPVAQALEHKESNTGLDTAAGYVMDEIDKEYNPTDYFSLLADTKALLQRALVSLGVRLPTNVHGSFIHHGTLTCDLCIFALSSSDMPLLNARHLNHGLGCRGSSLCSF
jgi:hypothetical protein